MKVFSSDEMRTELTQLLRKQADFLGAHTDGPVSDADRLDYELRQEAIRDLCTRLANSSAA